MSTKKYFSILFRHVISAKSLYPSHALSKLRAWSKTGELFTSHLVERDMEDPVDCSVPASCWTIEARHWASVLSSPQDTRRFLIRDEYMKAVHAAARFYLDTKACVGDRTDNEQDCFQGDGKTRNPFFDPPFQGGYHSTHAAGFCLQGNRYIGAYKLFKY